MIVNQTSGASVVTVPFQAAYNASKAAIAMFPDSMRLELQPFVVTVIDLKTGVTESKGLLNTPKGEGRARLPNGSMYEVAKEAVESSMNAEKLAEGAMETQEYGTLVVGKLLKRIPPPIVWTGGVRYVAGEDWEFVAVWDV